MKRLFTLVLFLFSITNSYAGYKAGITTDSSSNMLMQPGGGSGSFVRLDGSLYHSITEKANVSYDTEFTFLQHYEGLQFHNHVLSTDYSLFSKESFLWDISASGNFARFGDVTVLDGYNSFGIFSAMKYYIRPTLLLRWGISVNSKDFMKYDLENYNESESYLRVDKFFSTKTTLRAQFDSGYRKYINMENDPDSRLFGGKILVAQSFGDFTGSSLEFQANSLSTDISQSDSSRIYNRVFLDDKYKYSQKSLTFTLTRLLPGKGSLKLAGTVSDRKYDESALSDFDYLPYNGWNEKGKSVSFTVIYKNDFLPGYIHPSYRLYYIDINASEPSLSYDSAGMSINFSIY